MMVISWWNTNSVASLLSAPPRVAWWPGLATKVHSCHPSHQPACRSMFSIKSRLGRCSWSFARFQSQSSGRPSSSTSCQWSSYSAWSGAAGSRRGRSRRRRPGLIGVPCLMWKLCRDRAPESCPGIGHYHRCRSWRAGTGCRGRSSTPLCTSSWRRGRARRWGRSWGCAAQRNCPPSGNDDPCAGRSGHTYCSGGCAEASRTYTSGRLSWICPEGTQFDGRRLRFNFNLTCLKSSRC